MYAKKNPLDVLIVLGAGYLGQQVALEARVQGVPRVVAIKRRPLSEPRSGLFWGIDFKNLDFFSPHGLLEFKNLLASILAEARSLKEQTSTNTPLEVGLFYCFSPAPLPSDTQGKSSYENVYVHGLNNLLRILKDGSPSFHIVLASSTSVYPFDDGRLVLEKTSDENKPPLGNPGLIIQGEQILRSQSQHPWTILRYGGLYGLERLAFLNRVLAGEEPLFKGKPYFTNRIHVEDGARMVLFSLSNSSCRNEIFNAVDREPANRNDVISYLWKKNSLLPPPVTDDIGKIRHRGNKRCSSDKITNLGFEFKYPTFREGYLL